MRQEPPLQGSIVHVSKVRGLAPTAVERRCVAAHDPEAVSSQQSAVSSQQSAVSSQQSAVSSQQSAAFCLSTSAKSPVPSALFQHPHFIAITFRLTLLPSKVVAVQSLNMSKESTRLWLLKPASLRNTPRMS
jgi:hypothetical protein